jgi:predicted O-methyltransferase YrrM
MFTYANTKVKSLIGVILRRNLGQIQPNSDIGRWISLLSSLNDVNSIVEIGSYNGLGTSRIIAQAVKSNPLKKDSCSVYGLEIDQKMASRAKRKLRNYPFSRF